MTKNKEKTGTILIILSTAIWGMFPVLTNYGTKNISPLTFAALTTLVSSIATFLYMISEKKFYQLKERKTHFPLLMITICIVIIPYTLLFIGSSMTSGINTSLLLLSEVVFTLIFTPFIGERTTGYKLLGAGGIFFGALFILYNGTLAINTGDLLIILSTLTYPIGNFYAKKALNTLSPSVILFVRFLFGGLFILFLSIIFEKDANIIHIFINFWPIIIITGFLVLGLNKIIWYEGLKRIDISKSISLGATSPIFSLIVLILFFGEKISIYQTIGIFIMAIGVYFSIKRKSVDKKITKYAQSIDN